MLNIDPLLFQPKVIRLSTTSNIGLPGQHIIRTTEYSNSQVMTGTAAHAHNEANNNILTSNNAFLHGVETSTSFPYRGRHTTFQDSGLQGGRGFYSGGERTTDGFSTGSLRRTFGRQQHQNFNEMETTDLLETDDMNTSAEQPEWTIEQMYWSGEGECSDSSMLERLAHQNSTSIMSFQSNLSSSSASTSFHSQLSDQSESKEEMISALINKVKSHNKVEASKILLAVSNTVENCIAMRQCGCLPLLVDLLHGAEENCNAFHLSAAQRLAFEVRERAAQALHNVVLSQPDDRRGRREARVLKLLEQVRDYVDQLRFCTEDDNRNAQITDQNLGPAVAALMKLSFDEDHRHAMCQLGGLQAIAELLVAEQEAHGCSSDTYCVTVRRYAGMALTNLTFGDSNNKALLCNLRPFMEALVAQLYSPSEDLRQVTASVLRNLSWRADPCSKRALREVGAVPLLVQAAMQAEKESTLRSILSALWNLSAHCSANKADICRIEGALAFLVSTLTYRSKAKTLAIVENGGGILRNVSSHIAIQNDYRQILRRHNCLQILLHHLKSPSLTVVSNACGTLWNLSARNATDQRALWEMGAVGMLKKLIHSKHKMISMGSSAALKNLLSAQPPGLGLGLCDGYRGNDDQPSLSVRKQKALSAELDQNLAETYDNTDSPKTSPVKTATQQNRTTRRHASPSAARYLANQRLKNELSLTRTSIDTGGGFVVEEKHNGAFQVTKNAKQNFRPQEQVVVHRAQEEVVKQGIPSPRHRVASSRSMSPMGVKKEQHARGPSRPGRIPEPVQKTIQVQEPPKPAPHESRIPLPKSTKLDPQRSQSASPVPQRRGIPQPQQQQPPQQHQAKQQQLHSNAKYVDVTVTHPKYAWNNCSSPEKQDNDPEQPVNFSKRLGGIQDYPPKTGILKLQEDCSSEDEVKVYRTEHTPSNYSLNSSLNDLDENSSGARCSLNIRTSTNVRMIKNHPLLANRCDENGRLFESRNIHRDEHNQEYDGAGRTVEFGVQSEYDIEEELSMLSRSSSVASVSSFEQREDDDSDVSHHTSGIESPSELSDSPCQTAPTSPLKSQSSSNYISVCGDTSEQVQTTLMVTAAETLDDSPHKRQIPDTLLTTADDVSQSFDPTLRATSTSSLESADDISPSDGLMLEEVIEAGRPQKTQQHLEVKEPAEYESHSENEEKGKEDERKAEKNRLFRIPESPDGRDVVVRRFDPSVDQKGNRRLRVKAAGEPVPSQLEFLMRPDDEDVECDTSESRRPKVGESAETSSSKKLPSQLEFLRKSESRDRVAESAEPSELPCSKKPPSQLEFLRKSESRDKVAESAEPSGKKMPSQMESVRKTESIDKVVESAEPSAVQPCLTTSSGKTEKVQSQQELLHKAEEASPLPPSSKEIPNQLEFLMKAEKKEKASDRVERSGIPNQLGFLIKPACVKKVADPPHKETSSKKEKVPSQLEFLMRPDKPEVPSGVEKAQPKDVLETTEPPVKVVVDEKEVDSSSMDDPPIMVTSVLLNEAKEIAEALLGARVDSTEDMTVSTLSCLSDIDSARPPSAMADLGCMSLTNSIGSDDLLVKAATKAMTSKGIKKSLLRELQMGRLGTGDSSNDSSRASDLLGNVNPPSILDEMSLTASTGSLEGSDCSESEGSFVGGRLAARANDSSSERMHDAAAMANIYARELSNITGKQDETMKPEQDRMDDFGSDTELEDDLLPRDDDDTRDDEDDTLGDGYFMTSEELKALRENADMILNTLKDVEISDEDEEEHCGNSSGDLLEDETMSLVSSESDDEFPSPPREPLASPTCTNGMVALPLCSPTVRKVAAPVARSMLPKTKDFKSNSKLPEEPPVVFDTRTFTRKKTTVPKEMVPSVPAAPKASLRSPLSAMAPSFPGKPQVESRIAGVWKNSGKSRSKSADVSRNSKLKMAAVGTQLSYEDDKSSQRSSSQSSSPKSPLSRSNTFERLADDPQPQIRRPSSLALAQSPRRAPPQRAQPPLAPSPSSTQIPKFQTHKPSLIPGRRSMIPKPGSFGGQRDN